ncbi:MAG: hypothetical protein M3296_08345, partial [Actinomycetota bacterium]|nr:hypothetical protein [Actinomycetota bacterium]
MSRLAGAFFAMLVVGTFGAFFVAQRLKAEPGVIGLFRRTPFFSPNGDGRFDRARLRFELRREDRISVTVIDARGEAVRALVRPRRVRAHRQVRARWDGRDDRGGRVADGVYRYRITLQREARSVVVPRPVRVDTVPPRVRVLSVGPRKGPEPELLPAPGGGVARVRVTTGGRRRRILLFRTAPGAPKLVRTVRLPDGVGIWRWNGLTRSGRPASAGSYLVGVEARDLVGNLGRAPELRDDGLPPQPYGRRLRDHAGITVRYIAVQPVLEPVGGRRRLELRVDARGRPWRWRLRRIGSRRILRRGRRSDGRLRLTVPGRRSAEYVLEVRSAGHVARAPLAVQGRRRRPVLLVLPAITWQGRNPVDDDGDGLADVLDRGVGVLLGRTFAGDGTPPGFSSAEGLLSWLARSGRRFDVTTDVALARRA